MGRVIQLFDRLSNALTGVGTSRDARSANRYTPHILTQADITAAYSGSGLMRKIIRIPALDMVREWRTWNGAESEQIAALYEEEKRLGLQSKVLQAEVLRGLGGGAFILGLPGNPSEPAPPSVGKSGLAFVNVVSRWHLSFDNLQSDASEEGYGEPLMWKVRSNTGQVSIHPSRVVPFRADTNATLAMTTVNNSADAFWGESTVAQVLEAVQDSDTARASFAAMLHKARLLRIGIPRLMEISGSPSGEEQIMTRLAILARAESVHNATVYDSGGDDGKGGEEIDDATYSFAGAKDIINAYGEFVSAISDIPATRLLGRAPEGMNSSGDSQQKDWAKKIRAMQTLDLAPVLDRVGKYLVPSALGSAPPTLTYEFDPLDTPSQKEQAERFKTQAEAIDKLQATGIIPDRALSRGVQSLLIEEGYLPELEAALNEMSDDERFGIPLDVEGGDLPPLPVE